MWGICAHCKLGVELDMEVGMADYYEIRIKGHFSPFWSDWFGGLEITQMEGDETLISGLLVDQAALYGLLRRIRDLNLTLVSVSLRTQASLNKRIGEFHHED